jgi:hypothetical protein
MAFADKREAAFWLDQSGNNNDWTNNNMQESDISLDSPLNNFATLNPIDPHSGNASTLSEGNLKASSEGSNSWSRSSFHIESKAYYCEILSLSSSGQHAVQGNYDSNFSWTDTGEIVINGSNVGTYASHTSGDILGLAIDRDANTVKFYKNNTLVYTGTSLSSGAIKVGSFFSPSSGSAIWNFGQDSSFAGNKVAQGNQDANGKGDFYYEPPAGYLALCADNLPDPVIKDGSEYFNTVLYTGTNAAQSITGVGFQPDWTWLKSRSNAQNHRVFDVIRGTGEYLETDTTDAEGSSSTTLTSFDSDGFSLGGSSLVNTNTYTYVAWNWKADNTSGTTNTDGTITSTVSANPTAGFSVVGYTGNGSNGTVGHGLGVTPNFIVVKNRSNTADWPVYFGGITSATEVLRLNSTTAKLTGRSEWNSTLPTSTLFSVGNDSAVNTNNDNYIAYCFAEVEGYSKFGSYTGNGSTDGPFVYTGFRPAFVLIKAYSQSDNWNILDTKRDTYNVMDTRLLPNNSTSELTASTNNVDFISNGFKLRTSDIGWNGNAVSYIYMAFAENPFKYSNAR